MHDLTTLPNIGEELAAKLETGGVTSRKELSDLGSVAAVLGYGRLNREPHQDASTDYLLSSRSEPGYHNVHIGRRPDSNCCRVGDQQLRHLTADEDEIWQQGLEPESHALENRAVRGTPLPSSVPWPGRFEVNRRR